MTFNAASVVPVSAVYPVHRGKHSTLMGYPLVDSLYALDDRRRFITLHVETVTSFLVRSAFILMSDAMRLMSVAMPVDCFLWNHLLVLEVLFVPFSDIVRITADRTDGFVFLTMACMNTTCVIQRTLLPLLLLALRLA